MIMPLSSNPNIPSRRLVLGALAALPTLPLPFVASAQAQTTTPGAPLPTGGGFSFAAVGDTRPMMYLPSKEGQPDLTKFFVEMFGLVMPFESKTEVMTLTVDKGWVTEASVEDLKLLPGVHRTMFRLQGGVWVTREIVKDVQSGRAKFVINSGDVVWWG